MGLMSFFQQVDGITPDEVKKIIKEDSPDSYCIVDVRQPGEYEQGHLPGARLIPLGQLKVSLSKMDKDKRTIVYCRTASRSASAVGLMAGEGFTHALNMEGGIVTYNGMTAGGPPQSGAFCFPDTMSPGELVAMASFLENGSKTFYQDIKIAGQGDPESIDHLLAAKASHLATLRTLYESITSTSTPEGFPNSVLNAPQEAVMAGCVKVADAVAWAKGKTLNDMLEVMMSLEANTLDIYLKLSRLVPNAKAKEVFGMLAEAENKHLDELAHALDKIL
jgi:rhodanese-related sulfurtransferase/rubrerythrin